MSHYFHFSEAVSLALHGLEIMARDHEKVFSAKELAARMKASEAHLAKVFQRLVKTELLTSFRGPNGGFVLRRNPRDITISEIFDAIEGKVNTESCPLIHETCPFSECIFSGIMYKFQTEFNAFIGSHTLSDFIQKSK